MIHEPRLLLLDEPTAGVDPQSREKLFEVIQRIADEGTTILYTTHYIEEAERPSPPSAPRRSCSSWSAWGR
jgi:ABC-2 type transport system ATP-binding protein